MVQGFIDQLSGTADDPRGQLVDFDFKDAKQHFADAIQLCKWTLTNPKAVSDAALEQACNGECPSDVCADAIRIHEERMLRRLSKQHKQKGREGPVDEFQLEELHKLMKQQQKSFLSTVRRLCLFIVATMSAMGLHCFISSYCSLLRFFICLGYLFPATKKALRPPEKRIRWAGALSPSQIYHKHTRNANFLQKNK